MPSVFAGLFGPPAAKRGGVLVLWHGSQDWEGPGEIRRAKAGSILHGPGLYLTTSADTARKYAKGGGSVIRIELELPIRWLSEAKMLTADAVAFVRDLPRLRHRKQILEDLKRAAARHGDGSEVWPGTVLNLMSNADAIKGDQGPALARFLVENGVDAELVQRGTEDWVVLYNPGKIVGHVKVPAGKAKDAPRIVPLGGLFRSWR